MKQVSKSYDYVDDCLVNRNRTEEHEKLSKELGGGITEAILWKGK